MPGRVLLVLHGAWYLNQPQRKALDNRIREELQDIVAKAGKTLAIRIAELEQVVKANSDTIVLDVYFVTESKPARGCGLVLADCGSRSISITAHEALEVCGPDPRTREKVLITDELLGQALGNTTLHELGHIISGFEDNREAGNIMSTLGLPKMQRTRRRQQEYFAGALKWTPAQTQKLIEDLKTGPKGYDITFQ